MRDAVQREHFACQTESRRKGRLTRTGAAQHSMNTSHQFVGVERFVKVIVRSLFESHGALTGFANLHEQNDRGPVASLAKLAEHLAAVNLGHQNIQDE